MQVEAHAMKILIIVTTTLTSKFRRFLSINIKIHLFFL